MEHGTQRRQPANGVPPSPTPPFLVITMAQPKDTAKQSHLADEMLIETNLLALPDGSVSQLQT